MKRNVLRAARWIFFESVAKNVLLLGFTVVLARLLTPADFGVIAMLSLFVGTASALAEGGMGAALIQAKEPTQADISTLFWSQLGLATLFGGVLAASGPALANWFEQEILAPLAVLYGLNLLISAPASVQLSLFNKELQFRAPAFIALTSQVVAGIVAIVAALYGAGPWAIIMQAITASAITTALLWKLSAWRPSFVFSCESLRRFAGFGLYSVGTGILAEIEHRVGSLAIGLVAGPAGTGHYQRASSLQLLLARLMSGVVTRVAFPAFAAVQEDKRKLGSALREAAFVNFSATALVMWTVAVVAEPLIRLLFGPAWAPGAPVLQALCLAAGFYPLYAVFSKALRALGRSRDVFFQHFIRAAGMAIVTGVFSSFSLGILAWAQSIFIILTLAMGTLAVGKWANYPPVNQVKDMLPVIFSGIMMAIVGLAIDDAIASRPDLLRVLTVSAVSISTYVLTMTVYVYLLPVPPAKMAWATIVSLFPRERT